MIADDLFAGAGGWDLAAAELGIHARGVEIVPEARATRDAAGLATIHDDVWTFEPDGKAAGLIASPPCQTFSMGGARAGREAIGDIHRAIANGAYRSLTRLRGLGMYLGDDRTALVLTPLHFATNGGYEWLACGRGRRSSELPGRSPVAGNTRAAVPPGRERRPTGARLARTSGCRERRSRGGGGMTGLYECDVEGCGWENPNWRYGFAEAGATWAEHMGDHSRVHNHRPYVPACNERLLPDGQLRGACLNDDGTDRLNPPGVSSSGGGRQ